MATKQKVAALAKKTRCEFRVEGRFVDLIAPEGKHLDYERHIMCFEAGDWQTKSEIYDDLIDAMDSMRDCDCA